MRTHSAARLLSVVVLSGSFAMLSTTSFAAGAFDGMAGYWNGSGKVELSDGSTERIRCRASYAVAGEGRLLQQTLVCASTSAKFDITSHVEENGGRITGTWTEASRNANGQVTGTARGGRVDAQVAGPGFSASLSVATRGASQSVSIVPQGTNVRNVSVSLKKR
ncbi:conserved hypothetical protein [Rhodopseudomonas palustris HaA2]|uniref:Uncharacterized protein n=1 Tax=Rhodopseudomonas palustris (strain HaA2) TaxID=316058 RepID=Q2J1D2_RHOP2|nr:hypothetical protein [Rhodopseudomonas palustris]ABD05728.1 conserved hypothetical protein [Rhodopseudomonas palustris HaA2]